jgi:hypothetical protein
VGPGGLLPGRAAWWIVGSTASLHPRVHLHSPSRLDGGYGGYACVSSSTVDLLLCFFLSRRMRVPRIADFINPCAWINEVAPSGVLHAACVDSTLESCCHVNIAYAGRRWISLGPVPGRAAWSGAGRPGVGPGGLARGRAAWSTYRRPPNFSVFNMFVLILVPAIKYPTKLVEIH